MTTTQIQRPETGRINVSGELGAHSVPSLLRSTRGWFDDGDKIIVDLSQVERADSAGVALLLDWWRQAQNHNTQIHYSGAPAQMLDIIRFCALEDVLPLN